jgi:hypothetical protein
MTKVIETMTTRAEGFKTHNSLTYLVDKHSVPGVSSMLESGHKEHNKSNEIVTELDSQL